MDSLQENINPNSSRFESSPSSKLQTGPAEIRSNEKSPGPANEPELREMIISNIKYQNEQTDKKALMKESLMKASLDKDFDDLFLKGIKPLKFEAPIEQKCEEKSSFLEVPQEIKQIFDWLEESEQYSGMAYLPLNSYTKFFHVLHQKLESVAIIVTEYPIYYLSKMEHLNRLSKLKWAFLNCSLETEEEMAKILEMYELNKIKLLFITPSMFKSLDWPEFKSEVLVFCDFELYREEKGFVSSVVSRCQPNRVLGLSSTIMKNSMPTHVANDFHYINAVSEEKTQAFNYIVLKCGEGEKQRAITTYLSKNFQNSAQHRTLVIINKKSEATQLCKKMQMDSKSCISLMDHVSFSDLMSFNLPELFSKAEKTKEEQKILDTLKRFKNTEIIISCYSDILKFEQFDLVVFYSFTDVNKFVENCPNSKNKLLLFDEDDYHNFRNQITSEYLNHDHLQRLIVKIIEKPQKSARNSKKRFYSDYLDDRLAEKYSVAKNTIEKDEEKTILINSFCQRNSVTQKNFNRVIDGLVEIGMISIKCKAIHEVEIEEQCLVSFRRKFPELTEVRKKVNLLNSTNQMKTSTVALLNEFKKQGVRFKVTGEALQFKVLNNYEDVDWSQVQTIVNRRLMNSVAAFDRSLDVFKECAYGSIELTRREKVLQRKQVLLKFALEKQQQSKGEYTMQTEQVTQPGQHLATEGISSSVLESFHKSNLLTSEIEEYLRSSEEGITDEHELVMLLQGVERTKTAKEKEEWIFGRYRKMKYEDLFEAVSKLFKNKRIKA